MLHIDPSEIRITDPRAVRARIYGAGASYQTIRASAASVEKAAAELADKLRDEREDRALQAAFAKYRVAYDSSVDCGRRNGRQIMLAVSYKHSIPVDALKGFRRTTLIVRARMEAMYLIAYERPDYSLPSIGRMFNKDHTTVLHAIRMHAKRNGLPPVVRS